MPTANSDAVTKSVSEFSISLESKTIDKARDELVANLVSSPEIASAGIAADGYSIWLKFADGLIGAINTEIASEDEDNSIIDNPKLVNSNPPAFNRNAGLRSLRRSRLLSLPVVDEHKHSPISKSVLLMSTATEHYKGADSSTLESLRTTLMDNHGWEHGDVTTKLNQKADGYGTLGLHDMIDVGDYGVIVLISHSMLLDPSVFGLTPNAPDPEYVYVQVGAAATLFDPDGSLKYTVEPLTSINVQTELDTGRLLRVMYTDYTAGTSRWYIYMREDLFFSYLPSLPNSLVYLGFSNSSRLAATFGIIGSGSTFCWDGSLSTTEAIGALTFINTMASQDLPDRDAFVSTIVGPGADFEHYPRWLDGALYLPSWINCQTRNYPSSTVSTAVEVSYSNPDIPLPAFPRVEDIPHVGHEITDLIAGHEVNLHAEALDVDENILLENDTSFTVKSGANNVIVYLSEYHIGLTANPRTVLPGETVTLTASCITLAGDPLADKEITFSTDFGKLSGTNPITTNKNGEATIQLTSGSEGTAMVTATVIEDEKKSVRRVEFGSPTTYYLAVSAQPIFPTPECAFGMREIYIELSINGEVCYSDYREALARSQKAFGGCMGEALLGDRIKLTLTGQNDPEDKFDVDPFVQTPLYLHYCPLGRDGGTDCDLVQTIQLFDESYNGYMTGTITSTVVLE